MSNRKKWNDETSEKYENGSLRVCLFVSRNKDNRSLENYKERREAFLTSRDENDDKLLAKFETFVNSGLKGEFSRFYLSVNKRDNEKTHRALLHYLIDHPDFNLASLPAKIASEAAKTENSSEKKWFFDVDDESDEHLAEFLKDLQEEADFGAEDYRSYKTPHGFAVVVCHGFDTRKLLEKWSDTVTLKRDDLRCVKWGMRSK